MDFHLSLSESKICIFWLKFLSIGIPKVYFRRPGTEKLGLTYSVTCQTYWVIWDLPALFPDRDILCFAEEILYWVNHHSFGTRSQISIWKNKMIYVLIDTIFVTKSFLDIKYMNYEWKKTEQRYILELKGLWFLHFFWIQFEKWILY